MNLPNVEFDCDVTVDIMQVLTDTSKSNLMLKWGLLIACKWVFDFRYQHTFWAGGTVMSKTLQLKLNLTFGIFSDRGLWPICSGQLSFNHTPHDHASKSIRWKQDVDNTRVISEFFSLLPLFRENRRLGLF